MSDNKHKCPYCNGTGYYYMEGDLHKSGGNISCGMCAGKGTLTEKQRAELEKVKSEFNSVIKGDLPRSGIFKKKLKSD